jgi:hypothetical protein
MDRSALPRELRPFVDADGRLIGWPARQKTQRMAVALLASRFEPGREYSEKEVNFLLLEWHTFRDWALLRRSLVDWRHLQRESDGTRYRLAPERPDAAA